MSLPRYPEYKDSGVEWLGEVPAHWVVLPIKRLSPVQRGASPRPIDDPKYFAEDGEYSWVRIADVSASSGVLTESSQQLSDLGSNLSVKLNPGELFVSIAGTVGKPCITAIKACIHDGFVYFPLISIPPKFLYRIFEAGQCYSGLGKWGTQLNLNTDTIGSIQVAIPPCDEIKSILDFLDRETAKIDTLIAEQEKLLTLLAEKRQATISHAVTKGLDPDVPMRDSGVEWLGKVPAHWVMKRLRSIAALNPSKSEIAGLPKDKQVSFLPMEAIGEDGSLNLENTRQIKDVETGYTYFRNGDLAVAKITPCFENGKGALMSNLIGGIGFGTTELTIVRPKPELTAPDYLNWIFRSSLFRKLGEASMYGAGGQKRIPDNFVRNFALAFPPLSEQVNITNFLEVETNKLEKLAGNATRAITLLKERRSALISAAVTGKIDVREAA